MVALQLCVTDCGSGNGSKGQKKKSYKERKSTGVMDKGGGTAWKHREETALHPDSVTENKDNLFPSHSITEFTVLLMETQLEGTTRNNGATN